MASVRLVKGVRKGGNAKELFNGEMGGFLFYFVHDLPSLKRCASKA